LHLLSLQAAARRTHTASSPNRWQEQPKEELPAM